MSEHEEAAPPPDLEVVYYDGNWYAFKRPEFKLPPFEFTHEPYHHISWFNALLGMSIRQPYRPVITGI